MTGPPNVLVCYASADGSTATIAGGIGSALSAAGCSVTTRSVADDYDPRSFDAVVLGSAIHDGDFLPEFHAYVEGHHDTLAARPTWLFSVGMAPAAHGPIGALARRVVPPPIAAIRDSLGAKDFHAFAGVFERPPERRLQLVIWLMGVRLGDNRDWADVSSWATRIAEQLQ